MWLLEPVGKNNVRLVRADVAADDAGAADAIVNAAAIPAEGRIARNGDAVRPPYRRRRFQRLRHLRQGCLDPAYASLQHAY